MITIDDTGVTRVLDDGVQFFYDSWRDGKDPKSVRAESRQALLAK